LAGNKKRISRLAARDENCNGPFESSTDPAVEVPPQVDVFINNNNNMLLDIGGETEATEPTAA
jgi:hypothetical protein